MWTLSSCLTSSLKFVTPSPSLAINPSFVYGSPKNRTLSTTMVPFGARSPKSQIICNMATRLYNCLNNTDATGMKLVTFWYHLIGFEFICKHDIGFLYRQFLLTIRSFTYFSRDYGDDKNLI